MVQVFAAHLSRGGNPDQQYRLIWLSVLISHISLHCTRLAQQPLLKLMCQSRSENGSASGGLASGLLTPLNKLAAQACAQLGHCWQVPQPLAM